MASCTSWTAPRSAVAARSRAALEIASATPMCRDSTPRISRVSRTVRRSDDLLRHSQAPPSSSSVHGWRVPSRSAKTTIYSTARAAMSPTAFSRPSAGQGALRLDLLQPSGQHGGRFGHGRPGYRRRCPREPWSRGGRCGDEHRRLLAHATPGHPTPQASSSTRPSLPDVTCPCSASACGIRRTWPPTTWWSVSSAPPKCSAVTRIAWTPPARLGIGGTRTLRASVVRRSWRRTSGPPCTPESSSASSTRSVRRG
jgi:hypothetical protein